MGYPPPAASVNRLKILPSPHPSDAGGNESRNTMERAHFYPFHRQSGNTPVYNFEDLDVLIDQLWQLRLKPGLEIMGNPSNFFTDFENKTQVYLWRDLVHEIAARYVGKCAI